MAFANSFESKPKTFKGSVFLDCEDCVFGAGGKKSAAMAEKRA
jgi:hypothetical protein